MGNLNGDDSYFNGSASESIDYVVSPRESHYNSSNLVKSRRRPLSRGRVHNYECQPQMSCGRVERAKLQKAEDDVTHENNAPMLDMAHKLLSNKRVNITVSEHVSKIRFESPLIASERARLLSSSPLISPSVSLETSASGETVSVERARLASSNCPNKLYILPQEEESSPIMVYNPLNDLEPPDCCSPEWTSSSELPDAAKLRKLPAPFPIYTIDKEQLFPGSVFDSHCHLDFIYRRLRGEKVFGHVQSLQSCLDMDGEELGDKFGGCVANFCHPGDWGQGRSGRLVSDVISDSVKDRRIFLTIGCHPHYADRMQGNNKMDQLAQLVSGRSRYFKGKVVAVGECGLDYSKKNTVPKEIQKQVFADQLKLALKFKLPIVLHIRNAEADGYSVLQTAGVPSSWPMHRHCFTGDWATASTWLDRYPKSKIGVTGLVTYPEAIEVHQVVGSIPLNRLLLETDAPYFLPARTDKNVYSSTCALPSHVLHVAAQVAAIKQVQLKVVLEHNLSNIKEIYRVGSNGVTVQGEVEIVRAKFK